MCRDTVYAGTYCPHRSGRSTLHDFVSQKNAVLIARPYGHLKSYRASLVCHCERYCVYDSKLIRVLYINRESDTANCCFVGFCFYGTVAMCHRSPFTKDTWFPFIVVRTCSKRYRDTQLFRSFRIIISPRFITVLATADHHIPSWSSSVRYKTVTAYC
jgi:hypothetical protein